jgi:hypothetical protein
MFCIASGETICFVKVDAGVEVCTCLIIKGQSTIFSSIYDFYFNHFFIYFLFLYRFLYIFYMIVSTKDGYQPESYDKDKIKYHEKHDTIAVKAYRGVLLIEGAGIDFHEVC